MNRTIKGLSLGILTVALVGCATNKSVDEKINARVAEAEAKSNTKIESVAGQVETVQQHQKEQDAAIASLSQEAKDALKRATDAGVLAKGKVAFQQTFGEDRIKFKVDKYELNDEAKAGILGLVQLHAEKTASTRAFWLMSKWEELAPRFVRLTPKPQA